MRKLRQSTYPIISALSGLALLLCAMPVHAHSIPDDFVIRLERTRCYGESPAYSVTVDAQGHVTYEGTAAVRVQGQQFAKISVKRVLALAATVHRIDFEHLRERYSVARASDGTERPVSVDDAPTTYVSVTRNGRTRRVEDCLGAPDGLKDLEREIDDAAGTKRWIRIEGETVLALARDG